jgi:DNA-binding NtrC family response regulator
MRELGDCGIVFAGGDSLLCLSLLRRVREEMPRLPFVVVAKSAGTGAWLEALGAGATDYCCLPVERRQIQRLMEPVISLAGRLSDFSVSAGYSAKRWIHGAG